MTEQKVKKRGWVKNAAIIFLAVMLVLTFFSQTFMNHSLPEVAAQYVQSGTISAKIRGTGTVTANETFEVKNEQTREVLSVPVQVGDEVKIGDTLVLFGDAESTQLKEAQAALDALILSYKKAIIGSNDGDYTKENRGIQLAQEALDKAKVEKEKYSVTDAQLAEAKNNVSRVKLEVTAQQLKVENLDEQFSKLSKGNDNSAAYESISNKKADIAAEEDNLKGLKNIHDDNYKWFVDYANDWMTVNGVSANDKVSQRAAFEAELDEHFTKILALSTFPSSDILPYKSTLDVPDKVLMEGMVKAYSAIKKCTDKISALKNELDILNASIDYGDPNYDTVKTQLKDENTQLTYLKNLQTDLETKYTELEEKKTKFDTADASVTSNQKSLEDLMFALAEQQKEDGKTKSTEALDLAAQRKQIEDKNKELAELKKGGDGASVLSKVNGIVSSITAAAGKTTEAATALMVIEIPDRGYGVSFSVTTEQSKKLKVGDMADITNNYSGKDLTATLVGIKTDAKNPGTNKLLNFKMQGEVESGAQLSLSIGERGASYETIVPSSSVRSDNNGSFVLAVVSKSSPLGNRYIAQRIDVKVIASDDVNTAVSGGITTSEYIITTSTKPIEPGMQVRMPD